MLVNNSNRIQKMATKSSIHIKPCNITSSEAHNRRTPEYMRNIGDSKIYIVPELSSDNEQWINPSFDNVSLRTHYDNIKRMVKEKTGRAMQEKERERKGKNGKIIKVAGCSPIREGVLLIKGDTTMADLLRLCDKYLQRWGITPLQIFMHKDEGHWLSGEPDADDKESFKIGDRWFKPNYHAHIVFDWMNHETGKSYKLNDNDMMEMQTLASEILLMERGQSKTETGKEHLERNDYILKKQKSELRNLDAVRRYKEYQVECAELEVQEAETKTQALRDEALQKEKQSEMLDKAISDKRSKLNREKGSQLLGAFADWATGKSKALKGDIEDLKLNLAEAHEAISDERKKTQEMVAQFETYKVQAARQLDMAVRNVTSQKNEEIDKLRKRILWQNHIIGCLSYLLLRTNEIFRKAVNNIIHLAKDYWQQRFDVGQVTEIKNALNLFGDDKQSQQAAGDFLYFTAKQKGDFDSREQIKVRREVDNVVDGHYDHSFKRGFSRRR